MNSLLPPTREPARPRLAVLLLVTAAGIVAATSQAWASALGTAAAVYTALLADHQAPWS
ncbi:hypothetical protein ACWCQL_13795 [Streptomyces sp. NPDC002073]